MNVIINNFLTMKPNIKKTIILTPKIYLWIKSHQELYIEKPTILKTFVGYYNYQIKKHKDHFFNNIGLSIPYIKQHK